MQQVFQTIDNMLNDNISFDINFNDYKIINNFHKPSIIKDILNYLNNSSILRYDSEYDAFIIEIIGGFLIIRIDKFFKQLHLCYCRYYISIPWALNLIC